ncbi:MAG TPA: fumarylacetoacetate hydrolase family protein [Vulgatibacter sp.]
MTRIIRFDDEGTPRYGRAYGDGEVQVLSSAPWHGGTPVGKVLALEGLRLLAPSEPTKVVCAGRNYAAHARELGNELPKEPLVFIKPASSVVGPGDAIRLPPQSADVQHEAELALVIGKRCRGVSEHEAKEYVAGFTCLNDVTARDIQRAEGHFTRSKSFDSFCPIGPWIVEGWDDEPRAVRCRVGDELRQDGNTRAMIFRPAALVAFVSSVMTLEPGDVIATGTPAGVARIEAGQTVAVEIERIGTLSNPVVAEGR